MRAAVMTAYDEPLVLEDLERDPLGPHDVAVRVDASGVCHSDLTILTGGLPFPPPAVLGHEAAGTVLETGDQVTRVRPGDRVIASFVPLCGECWNCVRGRGQFCRRAFGVSVARRWRRPDGALTLAMSGLGAFAEEMAVHEWSLVKVDTDLPAEQLALIGCGVATGVGAALNTARVRPGSTVAVIGCGGVGQFVVQGARIAGASRIIAVDPVAFKREKALALGATDAIDPGLDGPQATVNDLTAGRGVDYAFDVVGLPATILAAYDVVRAGGTAVIVGMPRQDETVTFPASALYAREKRLVGCFYGSSQVRRDFPLLVSLVETGRLDIAATVTRRLPLADVNAAFDAMQAGESIRSVLVPDAARPMGAVA
ncbi:Zn-dependent alcohol dehydrogenase [Frankia sp. AgB1.9]|uniref:Zn-dependent alcohol dehydrogenase n=1 Tax=unclassified Frankia TaxID=2632575 RepID=UPI0019335B70|nr:MULTISPECIES: Zn-dependent alcohol dehydrogenase [unclassified Frankia]MBL7486816.1 Zn-dependent alcohol dehydrogenase [Frankia sp. AgW1.1]MBL7549811.1 Zn-dependent alcohol dehydrogenase [Frankia sp. AgB1.9]MBL7622879.1 Zn-dependent alcohol dehydrogenase [Frankia sp. AgB1.8]